MKKALITSLLMIFSQSFGQINLEKLNEEFKLHPKPIIIYFYTDWCAYCKIQEKEIERINTFKERVYFIKLNAETDQVIHFMGDDFNPNKSNNKSTTHDFVKAFIQSNEQESYPFWVFLNENLEVNGKYNGLLTEEQLQGIISKIKMGTD